ncbi:MULTISPECIES: DUF5924 family protein [Sorangium]|uniref:DUF2914 domain-containing protein n=1 Tax=Sorangium cellulosum TaxID=56 RepID=A0A4P2QIF3_SORCE|nr:MULTISPECIES: DUF2914 domain-containing protein [Sorangium]AUX29388.1 hypothetical protein SOCE836_014780 [Sorangium cellulosum]WCQ88783.1 hypothetical protein NQZ70_01464 [Sorangium sp. Soce836]
MKQPAPRSPDASAPEAHANAPSRPSPPSSNATTLVQRPRVPDAFGEAPTIVYMPSDEPGRAPDNAAPGAPGGAAAAAAPGGRERGAIDDVTLRMPPKAGAPGGDHDDRTLKMPARPARSTAEDDAPTVKAEPKASFVELDAEAHEEGRPQDLKSAARAFFKRHHKKLWWLHTAYALSLGAFVVAFAQKGFQHARFLAISVSVAWLLVLLFFRLFGTGARQDFATAWRGARLRFLVMTYVLKNLYQGMLFFLLPFYWKSASLDAPNRWFVLLLGACAVLSTLDLVFDRVLMRWKTLASVFYGVTLFACLNLVIPALLPNTRTLYTLLSAALVSVLGFCTLHLPFGALWSRMGLVFLVIASAAGVGLAYGTREIIPPVPMHLSSAAVGPSVLPDGRLAMSVKSLHFSVIRELRAVTDVVVPGGDGDRLVHVWRHEGREILRAPEETLRVPGPEGAVRLKSQLVGGSLPRRLAGHWTVDVETEDGQLVGRTAFEVTE